ncbi:MAG: endolytic transglycosylase MltG [Alphaproteobacteria bacterium]|nr:endolytic transglycosylase MltG [Alphaproteobacteria bacterium]
MKKRKQKTVHKSPFYIRGHRAGLVIIAVWVVAGALIAGWHYGLRSGVRADTTITVQSGASVISVARELRNRELISSTHVFRVAVRLNGGIVQRGLYDIPRGSGTWAIARKLANGRVATTTIVIPEGKTVRQIVAILERNPYLTGVACPTMCPEDGMLFPDTYRVARGTSRAAVIDLMRRTMDDVKRQKERNIRNGFPAPLYDWHDVINLAAIVQRETSIPAEMPKVAGVFINRLRTNMRLQADPTVVYFITDGLGDMQGRPLLRRHLQTPHPFNTYTNRGLPPHAIANPGRAAIAAVLNYKNHEYIFFVADGTGGHIFSRTYAEHRQRHQEWRVIRAEIRAGTRN